MNKNKPIVSFIIPALNEELNLPPLFERLLALEKKLCLECEIIVIDDSSQDRTLQVAQDAAEIHPQIRSLTKPLPHGLGCSVRAGLELAEGKVGVIVMADGVDPLEEAIPEFCEKILVEKCHLVLLSRYIDPINSKTIPFSYRFYHSLFRFFTLNLLGIPYHDTTYAFRAFDIEFIRTLNLRSTGFEISPEITFKTFFLGGRIDQVAGRQTRRVHGKSKFLFSKVAIGYFRVLMEGFRLRLRQLPN